MSNRLIVGHNLAGSVPARPLVKVQPIDRALPRRPTLHLNHGKSALQPAAEAAP